MNFMLKITIIIYNIYNYIYTIFCPRLASIITAIPANTAVTRVPDVL